MANITPKNVHEVLGRHILADGFDMVYDLEKSKGSYIYDSRNEVKLLDLFSFFASQPIGHNHPKVCNPEFIAKMGKVAIGNPSNSDIYTVEMAEFVDTVARVAMPKHMKYMFFISGGALAVENALKTAFDWKVRKNFEKGYKEEKGTKIIYFKEAFHGRTGYTLTMTNTHDPRKTKLFPKFDWIRVDNPKIVFPLEKHLNDVIEAEKRTIAQIMDAIAQNKDDIAAVIFEPIQGEGGDNQFRPEFVQQIQKICRENEMMFILDEVQSGCGMTGKMWAFEHYGVEPDIISFGKKMQVCGIFVSARVDEVKDNVFHEASRINSTWGGSLTDMVRATRYLEIIEEDKLVENAAKMGEYFIGKLHGFEPKVSNVRGKGLMIAFDLNNTETRGKFISEMYKENVVVLPCGAVSVRFRPFLDVKKEDIDVALAAIEKVLARI